MAKEYTLCNEFFNDFIEGCINYINQNDCAEENFAYWDELKMIREIPIQSEKWSYLLNSGIFHDAYGKLKSVKIVVEEDY